jgi:hypothetical protein
VSFIIFCANTSFHNCSIRVIHLFSESGQERRAQLL